MTSPAATLPRAARPLVMTRDDFSVSVMSSPSFDSLAEPQHGQVSGAGIAHRTTIRFGSYTGNMRGALSL
jgi:hypothetical protein